ncbi:MAG: hypothetical protein H7Y18_13745 [Clostridiaceae bacterium]|nr:hypothetical protein [Clostridiaceae bacterium]
MEQQNSQDKLNVQKNLGYDQCPFYRDQDEELTEDFTDLRHSRHHGCCGSNWWGYPFSFNPYSFNPYNQYPYSPYQPGPFYRDGDEEEDINFEEESIDQPDYRGHHHHHHCCCNSGFGYGPGFGYAPWSGYGPGFGYGPSIGYGNAPFYGDKNTNKNLNVNLDVDDMNTPGYRHSHHHDCEPKICLPKIPVPKMKWIKPKFYTPKCSGYPFYPTMPYGNMPYPNMAPYGNKNVNENVNLNMF